MKTLTLAAVFALVATPALAAPQDVPFPTREAVSVKVSTEGLDLSSQRDRQRLRSRVKQAVEAACNPSSVYSADLSPDRQCYREMARAVDSKLQAYALNSEGSAVAKN